MVFVGEEVRCGGLSTWRSSSEKKAARWSLVPAKEGSGKLGYTSNEFVVWWRCCAHEEFEEGWVTCSDFSRRRSSAMAEAEELLGVFLGSPAGFAKRRRWSG